MRTNILIRSTPEAGKERKEMFYLTTHSTHFIYGYMASDIWLRTILIVRKEGRKEMFLFNDALNTFYLRLYGVRHMVKDHSDSEKGNPLPLHRLLFPIRSKGSFICTIPVVDHWLEREIAQWVYPMKAEAGTHLVIITQGVGVL